MVDKSKVRKNFTYRYSQPCREGRTVFTYRYANPTNFPTYHVTITSEPPEIINTVHTTTDQVFFDCTTDTQKDNTTPENLNSDSDNLDHADSEDVSLNKEEEPITETAIDNQENEDVSLNKEEEPITETAIDNQENIDSSNTQQLSDSEEIDPNTKSSTSLPPSNIPANKDEPTVPEQEHDPPIYLLPPVEETSIPKEDDKLQPTINNDIPPFSEKTPPENDHISENATKNVPQPSILLFIFIIILIVVLLLINKNTYPGLREDNNNRK